MIYTKEEVKKEALKYFKGDDLAADKWIQKYCLKDNRGNLLEISPDEMHKRLAKEFARIELKYINPISEEAIYNLLKDFKYIIPGGSQMSGIANENNLTSLSNCFVIDSAKDSYGGIFVADQEQVQIMKRRGGVGHDLSTIRPSGSFANNSVLGGLAGMPLYMERFSNSTREVAQDGRRGALMLSVSDRHPDVNKFIDSKLEEGKVTGANISVRISDEFIKSVKNDNDFWQKFPIDSDISGFTSREMDSYDKLVNHMFLNEDFSEYQVYIKRIKAKKLWNKLIYNAWKSAEPGVLFWDTITKDSNASCYGKEWEETSTNPCGEIPLCPYDSCRLMAINLYSYVVNPFSRASNYFDFIKFKEDVRIAQRLMDDLIDLEIEKIDAIIAKIKIDPEDEITKLIELKLWEKIKQKAIDGRRTGLGITAEGDMLAALGISYGSEEGNLFCEYLHKFMAIEAYSSSIQLAEERGCFPIFDNEKEKGKGTFIDRILPMLSLNLKESYKKFGRRNISLLTIAPTGTISLMTQTTSGIEPLFMPFYKRRTKVEDGGAFTFVDHIGDKWNEYFVMHPKFIEWFIVSSDCIHCPDIAKEALMRTTEEDLQKLFEQSPYYKSIANDIDWKSAVKLQGQIQKWIDHSISKTINLPSTATEEQVNELYLYAHEVGCKGVTVYRDGCRSGVLIKNEEKKDESFHYHQAPKRSKELECDIYYTSVAGEKFMTIVGLVDNKPFEIFAIQPLDNVKFPIQIKKGKVIKEGSKRYKLTGKVGDKMYTINSLVWQMENADKTDTRKYSLMLRHGINPKFIVEQIEEYATISSFDKMVQRVLKHYILGIVAKDKCECGGQLIYQEGCLKCQNCEMSKCG